jgi:hypothetical protein
MRAKGKWWFAVLEWKHAENWSSHYALILCMKRKEWVNIYNFYYLSVVLFNDAISSNSNYIASNDKDD